MLILVLSPVESHNKPLDENEKHVYHIRTVIVLLSEICLAVLLWFLNLKNMTAVHLATVQNIANPSFVLDAWNNNIAYKCHYAPGDVNHDGYVNDDDASLIMKYIVGLLTLPTTRPEMDRVSFKQAADVNGDGDIDILDAISI
ncbi:MAG: accessory gene regulator B family protein [Oscillospiraceae bacterium]|nr:accessory gene regulator B family protein [Oscillospiraceae bacterium]